MVFQVRISRKAEIEIEAAYEWLKQSNASYADRWFQGLMNRLATLQEKPKRCSLATENNVFPEEVRQLLYGKRKNVYRILFVIRESTVFIVYVRHSKQALLTAEDWSEEE